MSQGNIESSIFISAGYFASVRQNMNLLQRWNIWVNGKWKRCSMLLRTIDLYLALEAFALKMTCFRHYTCVVYWYGLDTGFPVLHKGKCFLWNVTDEFNKTQRMLWAPIFVPNFQNKPIQVLILLILFQLDGNQCCDVRWEDCKYYQLKSCRYEK